MNLTIRQSSRICAMQVLYSRQAGGEDRPETELLAAEHLQIQEPDPAYMKKTIQGVEEHLPEIDERIGRYAKNWSVDRLPRVDLAILRLGIFELFWREDIPDGATINECVEMAKRYSTPEAGHYINGILSSCLREKKPSDSAAQAQPLPDE